MKTYIISALLILSALSFQPAISASSLRTATAAKECSDCVCKGPGDDGTCPKEKGKTCHCKK